jgi:outer membrane biosynthesis protein TonB
VGPTYSGCEFECLLGLTCDYWTSTGYTCDSLASFGCDCTGCDACDDGSFDLIFSGDDVGNEYCVDDDGGTRAVYDADLDAGEYVAVVEGFSTNYGTYELTLECMELTGVASADVSSSVVLSGLDCDDFGSAEEAVFVTGMAATLTDSLGYAIDSENVHGVSCATYSRRRALLTSMAEVGFTATIPSNIFDDDAGDGITSTVETQLLTAVSTGALSSALATASSEAGSTALASASVAVAESITTVATSTANEGVAEFGDTPSPTTRSPTPQPTSSPTPQPTTPHPTNPTPIPSPRPTQYPTTCTETQRPTAAPTAAPSGAPTSVPTPSPTGSFMVLVAPDYEEKVTLGRMTQIEWIAFGATQDCDVRLELIANDTNTTVVLTESHSPLYSALSGEAQLQNDEFHYEDAQGTTYPWRPDAREFGLFIDMVSWLRLSCANGNYLSVSAPFSLVSTPMPTAAPTQLPSVPPTSAPTQLPSIVPTPSPTTPHPTAMPTLIPSPSPTFSPTPYATILIVPQLLYMMAYKPAVANATLYLINLERSTQHFNITFDDTALPSHTVTRVAPALGSSEGLSSQQVCQQGGVSPARRESRTTRRHAERRGGVPRWQALGSAR